MKLRKFIADTITKHIDEISYAKYDKKNQIINEESFFNLDTNNIINNKYIEEFISDGSAYMLLDYYRDLYNLQFEDDKEIFRDPKFISFLKNELERYLEEAKENIYSKINYNSNKVTIYRALKVDDEWIKHLKKQGKRLGIYWTWDKDATDTYWADTSKYNTAILEAEINERYINWDVTLRMNTNPLFSEEKEIRLFKNTPIKLKSIIIYSDNNNKQTEIDISEIKNKTFYS